MKIIEKATYADRIEVMFLRNTKSPNIESLEKKLGLKIDGYQSIVSSKMGGQYLIFVSITDFVEVDDK